MARPTDSNEQLLCSFCGKSQRQVKKLIAGPGVYICDECIDLCNEIIDEELTAPSTLDLDNLPRPTEIYAAPNEYVVSQEEAKRTLSVAAYNHYRRAQAPAPGVPLDRHDEHPLHLRRCICRARQDHREADREERRRVRPRDLVQARLGERGAPRGRDAGGPPELRAHPRVHRPPAGAERRAPVEALGPRADPDRAEERAHEA